MEIKVNLELNENDRQLVDTLYQAVIHMTCALDDIKAAIGMSGTPFQPINLQPAKVTPAPAAPAEPAEPAEPAAPAAPAAPVAPVAPAAPAAEAETPAYTLDDLRSKVIGLTAKGKKQEARDIIAKYAPKVSAVPVDQLPAVMAELDALEVVA